MPPAKQIYSALVVLLSVVLYAGIVVLLLLARKS
jgi:hypothetical protein